MIPDKKAYPHCSCVFRFIFLIAAFSTQTAFSNQNPEDLFDLPLDQLVNVEVVSASRFKQKSSEAPSAVEVWSADDIRSFNWRTLADVLNATRGLVVRNDRNYSYLGTRGFSRTGDYNSRMLIMIDGRRMNDAVYDSGFIAEEFLLDMNIIDRIEYIPGSGSSVYGANALLGVVNVITKQGSQIDGFRVGGEAGSLDTYRGRATFGKQWDNGADLLVNGSQYYSRGDDQLHFPEFSDTNGGIAENMDMERTSRFFGRFSYHDFTLRGGFVDRFKRVPTASWDTLFNEKPNNYKERSAYIDLDYNTALADNLSIEIRAFHHWYDYFSTGVYDANEGVPPVERYINFDAAEARWWGGEFKLTGTQFKGHRWLAGVEFQYDQKQQLINYDVDPFFSYLSSNNHGWRAGVYLQDEYRISDSLLLNAGLRLDHHHMIKTLQLNPRIGLIWDISPTVTGKLLYGSAFRAPNVYERDLDIPLFGFHKNPNNREERIKSYEAVAEWRPGSGIKLLGTLFYNDISQVLMQDIDENSSSYGMFVNSGAYETFGAEVALEKRWDSGRMVKLTWTHNYTRDETLRGWSTDSPRNMVKLHYAEPLFGDALRFGIEELFIDERRTLGNNIASSYHLMNINLSTKPYYGFQAALGIYNVLDQRYQMVGGGSEHVQDTLTMDGRTVRFRLEYGF